MNRDPCGMCAHFTGAGYPERTRVGEGRCTGFDQPGKAPSFVAATGPWCWNFTPAADGMTAERRRFIEKRAAVASTELEHQQ